MTRTRSLGSLVVGFFALAAVVACGGGDDNVAATPTSDPGQGGTATPGPTATPALGADLVINGSLEDGVSEPDGWTLVTVDGQNLQWQTGDSRSGQSLIKFTTRNTGPPSPQLQTSVPLVLEKGKAYMLSAYMRTDQQVEFSFGMSWFEDDGVTRAGGQVRQFSDFIPTEWTQVSTVVDSSTFPLYENASIGLIVLRTNDQTGVDPSQAREFTLYVDDISLREIIE